jgi:hypothetical protein
LRCWRSVRWLVCLAALSVVSLSGCGSVLTEGTSDAAGLAGAGIAGAVTKNATVGAAIGLGVASAAGFGLRYVERDVHQVEQDRIAAAAGGLPEGAAGLWSVSHTIPIEDDEHGALVVTRVFAARPSSGADFICKDVVFSVDHGTGEKLRRAFYTATICLDGVRWKWASAEPATERWGSLQ